MARKMSNHSNTQSVLQLLPQRAGVDIQQPAQPYVEQAIQPRRDRRLNVDSENLKNGLAGLVLTLVKLLHELLEKQAIRRIEAGSLDEAECERIGFTLMKQAEQIDKLREAFGLAEEDLNLDLGPLGKLV